MNAARVFSLAQKTVDALPEAAGRALFDAVGIVAGLSNAAGVRQLRANHKRVLSAPLPEGLADAREVVGIRLDGPAGRRTGQSAGNDAGLGGSGGAKASGGSAGAPAPSPGAGSAKASGARPNRSDFSLWKAGGFFETRAPKACPISAIRERIRSVAAMRSYMRYYYEAFHLPKLSREQIEARVRVDGLGNLTGALETGAVTGALMHAGNWDLAGAWANKAVAPVHTIAEVLEPREVFQHFLDLREGLGLRISPLVKGGGALHELEGSMRAATVFTPLLADRDLTASGIEVSLCGHKALVAPGPALLAQRTGRPIVPVFSSYERIAGERAKQAGTRWGMVLHVLEPIWPATGPASPPAELSADLARMTQAWVSALEPLLREHLVDWHMLQKVFVGDLDPERLARARARAAGRDRAGRD